MSSKSFHRGELHLQEKANARDKIGQLSMRMLRDAMPDQHRQFFEGLEYIFLSTVDGQGRPQISLLTGCLLYTSPSPRDQRGSRMPSSA